MGFFAGATVSPKTVMTIALTLTLVGFFAGLIVGYKAGGVVSEPSGQTGKLSPEQEREIRELLDRHTRKVEQDQGNSNRNIERDMEEITKEFEKMQSLTPQERERQRWVAPSPSPTTPP